MRLNLKDHPELEAFSPTEKLGCEEFIAQVLWECLKNNDPEGVLEAVAAFIHAKNKLALTKRSGLPRSTLYDTLKKKANPTLKTLAHLINAACSE